jgi:hypothetical protein
MRIGVRVMIMVAFRAIVGGMRRFRRDRWASRSRKSAQTALAMPKTAEPWSLTTLREKLIKIGAKVVSFDRYATLQLAEVAVSRQMFKDILEPVVDDLAPRGWGKQASSLALEHSSSIMRDMKKRKDFDLDGLPAHGKISVRLPPRSA